MQVLTTETPKQISKDDVVFMVCPFCSHDIAAAWQMLTPLTDELGRQRGGIQMLETRVPRKSDEGTRMDTVTVHLQWLRCQNNECNEIVVQATRVEGAKTEIWLAVPKRRALPSLHQLVINPLRQDYLEAHTILDDSPRMSAVLSRRILADLLEQYAGLKQHVLAERIDEFIKDTRHPLWIRENLHYLREMGNFAAHTQEQKDALPAPAVEQVIINVDRAEAEWTLTIVADLFDYFIVAPQRDKDVRAGFDKKMADAKRKPITPLTT